MVQDIVGIVSGAGEVNRHALDLVTVVLVELGFDLHRIVRRRTRLGNQSPPVFIRFFGYGFLGIPRNI
jgi:hypothetical protein